MMLPFKGVLRHTSFTRPSHASLHTTGYRAQTNNNIKYNNNKNIHAANKSGGPMRTGQKVAKYDQSSFYRNTNYMKEPFHNGVPVERDTKTTLDFCDEAIYALYFNKPDEVIQIYRDIREQGDVPTEYDFYLYIYSLFKTKQPQEVISEYQKNPVVSTIDCRLYTTIFYSMAYSEQHEMALEFFENTIKPYWTDPNSKGGKFISENERGRLFVCIYDILITKPDSFDEIMDIFNFQRNNYPDSVSTIASNLILGYALDYEYDRVREILNILFDLGIKPSPSIIEEIEDNGKFNDIIQKIVQLPEKVSNKYISIKTKVDINFSVENMHLAMVEGNIEKVETLFWIATENITFYKDPYDISNLMLKAFIQFDCAERIESHLQWMKSINVFLSTEAANLLMHYYSTKNLHEKVVSLYNKMVEEWVEPNFFTYQILLNSYEQLGDFESIEKLLNQFKDEKMHNYYGLREIYHSVLRMCKARNDIENLKEYAEQFSLRYPELYKDEVEPLVQKVLKDN